VYAVPALLTLLLLVVETIFLIVALPETRGRGKVSASQKDPVHANENRNHFSNTVFKRTVESRIEVLKVLRSLHFFFLAIFSGVEFTLTFLTFDLLDWSNTQNGMLIGSIGIISALLQGGYVRRSMSKLGEGNMARRGVSSCAVGLVLLALLPKYVQTHPSFTFKLLQTAAACMAFTSATVVNSLTAFASLQCDEGQLDEVTGKVVEEHPQLAKGTALGKFRSAGQLGRALGPLLSCASYWTFGPSITYGVSAIAMVTLSLSMKSIAATRSS